MCKDVIENSLKNSHFVAGFHVVVGASVVAQKTSSQQSFEGNLDEIFLELWENALRVNDEVIVLWDELELANLSLIFRLFLIVCLNSFNGFVSLQLKQFNLVSRYGQILRVQRDVIGECIYIHLQTRGKRIRNNLVCQRRLSVAQLFYIKFERQETIMLWIRDLSGCQQAFSCVKSKVN